MKSRVFLEGNTIYLRALEATDLTDTYLQWLNDPEVTEFNSHAVFPNTREKMLSYYASVQVPQHVVLAIIDTATETHIGNIALQHIHWINRSAEFAILLGDKRFWGKGVGTEAARLMFDYGFNRLNLHRIYCGTYAGNQGMISIAEKLRMRPEGKRVEAVFKNGRFMDVLEFGVLRAEYQPLKP
jgi:RimJ/RimL family protein N-acetyltransferase